MRIHKLEARIARLERSAEARKLKQEEAEKNRFNAAELKERLRWALERADQHRRELQAKRSGDRANGREASDACHSKKAPL